MRQHQSTLFLPDHPGAAALRLEPVPFEGGRPGSYDEAWLRDLIFAHPRSLPIEEVEPVLAEVRAICTELPTPAGPADLLLLTASGGLVLIECKLWRNPEARRRWSPRSLIMLAA